MVLLALVQAALVYRTHCFLAHFVRHIGQDMFAAAAQL
jgi:hypothetical protein